MSKRIVVIGGGAAGMMAAIRAAEHGADVTLLEPNERLGKKLNITGKGRCNLTNDAPLSDLLESIPGNGRFLYGAFSRFSPQDTMAFFEDLGVPLKVERGRRVFPVSDRAFDVSAALERRLKRLGVNVCRERARSLVIADGALCGVRTDARELAADAAILATGGASYPATGSTGDGHRMAREAGHTVTPLRASLVPLCERGDRCARMQGLSLKNVAVTVRQDGKAIYEDFGELLFTHFGLSGPVILSASAHMRECGARDYRVELDLKPALDAEKLDKRLLADFEKYANSDFCNALDDLLPQKMIPIIVEESGVPPHKKVHDVTREERHALAQLLKRFTVEIAQTRPVTEAIVTAGGVSVREVEPKTMESKIVKGLYFAGEILDVDAYTGGFNLQIAWSTGHAAGIACTEA